MDADSDMAMYVNWGSFTQRLQCSSFLGFMNLITPKKKRIRSYKKGTTLRPLGMKELGPNNHKKGIVLGSQLCPDISCLRAPHPSK